MTAGGGTTAGTADRPYLAPAVLIVALTVLALVLRFYRLGDWNFEATEMFTLRDSLRPRWRNPRPLGYLLNYYLVGTFRPLDELGLRLLPALAGVLAIPGLYYAGRRVIGTRAALFAALLLTLSPLHVFYSQFARYWSLVFLFCAIYPFLIYTGVKEGDRRAVVLGVIATVLAVLSHPVAILLVGGPVIWLGIVYLRPHHLRAAWKHTAFRWGLAFALLLVAATVVRFFPLLRDWIAMHDENPGMGQFLLGPKRANGIKQAVLLTAYLESLTIPVALGGMVGIYLLGQRDRTAALFLTSLGLFPLLFIALVSVRTAVSTFYLLPAAPVFFLGAGVFLDRVFQVDWNVRPRWLVSATVLVVFLTAGAATLASQYRNGRRFDFRGVAQWLEPQMAPSDVVFSDQPMVLDHYLSGPSVQKLRRDPEPLVEAVAKLPQTGGRALWVVAPAPAHAFRTNLKAGGLAGWLYDNCQMKNTVGIGRLDFRQQYLQVYRCPPAATGGS